MDKMFDVYARLIESGDKKLEDVPAQWKSGVIDAYRALFGTDLEESKADEKPVASGRKRKRK